MSREGELSLRELVRKHMEQNAQDTNELKRAMDRLEVHAQYTRKSIDTHQNDLDKLKANRNKQIGFMAAVSVGFGLVVESIKHYFIK